MKKERIDILCVQQGLFESRNQAQRAIMAGIVRDENDYIDNPPKILCIVHDKVIRDIVSVEAEMLEPFWVTYTLT